MSQFDPNQQQFGQYPPHMEKPSGYVQQSNGKAIASLVLGVLSFCLSALAGIPAIILGVMALSTANRSQGRVGGQGLAIAGIVLGGIGTLMVFVQIALLLPAISAARDAARRTESSNNFKQIGFALHNYHDTYRTLPPAFSVDDDGKPLLSWRVHMLPYIEQQMLYEKFKLDEPWDSPHNKQLVDQMPDVFRSPGADTGTTETVYLAVVGQSKPMHQAAFRGNGRGTRWAEFTDGTSNTIMVVEANEDEAVVWTKPDDWNFDPKNPRRGLGELRAGGFLALCADGSVRFIRDSVDDETVTHLFCRSDGQDVEF